MKKALPVRAPNFVLFCALTGCSGESLDVGSDQGGSSGASGGMAALGGSGGLPVEPTTPLGDWPDPSACAPSASAPISGVWTGYVQGEPAYGPDNGNFKLSFSGMNGDELCGSVTFGDGDPPPAATDPDAPYPPGADTSKGAGALEPVEGLPYTIFSARMEGARLQFGISFNEIARTWCPLQTSYFDEWNGVGYGCLPNTGGGSDSGTCFIFAEPESQERVTVSCTQMAWCSGSSRPCSCDADGCVASNHVGVSFDIHVEGTKAEGVVDGRMLFLEQVP